MNDEILVPLDLSDAIAMIDRQKQQIAVLTTENKELLEQGIAIMHDQGAENILLKEQIAALKMEMNRMVRY